MKRILLALPLFALAAAVAPNEAQAKLGFTAYPFGTEVSSRGLYTTPFMKVPSIDWKDGSSLFQFHAFELLQGLTMGQDFGGPVLALGGNYYKTVSKKTISDRVDGVVQYGGSVDLVTNLNDNIDYTAATALFSVRAGPQIAGGMGAGLYIVPSIGLGYVDGVTGDAEIELVGGGTMQISVWVK